MRRRLPTLITILLLGALAGWAVHKTADRRRAPVVLQIEPMGIMGTASKLVLVTDSRRAADAGEHLATAESELRRLESVLSTWIDASPISRLNRAPAGQLVPVASELAAVLDLAQRLHVATQGAFDITARPLVEIWREAETTGSVPSAAAVEAARTDSSWHQIHLENNAVLKDLDSVRVDVDGIAKGWAIDRALERLARSGASGGMVEIGGDLRLFGQGPDGDAWIVAIRSPFAAELWAEIELRDGAVCSSGDYARFLIIGGEKFSHILDPRTGRPTAETRAVTVIGPDAATADAWATALSVLGLDGLDLLATAGNLEAMIVSGGPDDYQVTLTSGFRQRLTRADFDWIEATESGN
jgi:thiamine biosynthesis lipoprotein